MPTKSKKDRQTKRKHSITVSILVDLLIPAAILILASSESTLGPALSFFIAISLPGIHTLVQLYRTGKIEFITVTAILGVSFVAIAYLLKLPPKFFVLREVLPPASATVVLLISHLIGQSIPSKFFQFLLSKDAKKIWINKQESEYRNVLSICSWGLVSTMLVSAITNYIVATIILKSPVGSEAFNKELGILKIVEGPIVLSITTPVIAVLVYFLAKKASHCTGLPMRKVLRGT